MQHVDIGHVPKVVSGIILDTVNYPSLLNSLRVPPIFVNDLDRRVQEHAELLDRYLLTNYETATFTMIPSCECGKLVGGYLRGKTCPECHSEVLAHTETPIQSNLWLHVPEGIPAFISPIVYNELTSAFESNKIDVIRWVADVHYKANFDGHPVISYLKAMGVKRGYLYFLENFWMIIDLLLEKRVYTSNSDKRAHIKQWLMDHQDDIFTPVLPLPNRVSLVVEKTVTGRYSELSKFGGGVEAAMTIASLKTRIEPASIAIKESVTIKSIILLAEHAKNQYKFGLGRKEGFIRKHICGTRMPFTARNVITSLHGIHEYDELHIPWAQAIGLLRLHLTNKFLKAGYTPNEISDILMGHVNKYHPEIDRYLKELIAESKFKGIPVVFNRNPTLLRSSIQQFYITKVKSYDIGDNTISLSCLTLAG